MAQDHRPAHARPEDRPISGPVTDQYGIRNKLLVLTRPFGLPPGSLLAGVIPEYGLYVGRHRRLQPN